MRRAIPEINGQGLYLLMHNPMVKTSDNRYCGLGSLIYAAAQLEVNGRLSGNGCRKCLFMTALLK